MWSPEDNLPHRAGKTYESDLSLRYLAPGAFTILPPGHDPPTDPTPTSNKHRLTPTTKKHRNAAFAIIAEPGSNSASRSPSPTGRVSPFRGRGFNPVGSRHASPLPSPPPDGRRYSPTRSHRQQIETSADERRSRIPTLSRRGSTAELFFGEKIEHPHSNQSSSKKPTSRSNLTRQISQSLNNISPRRISDKPPPSPRTTRKYSKAPAFQKLSPIIGSSPERTPNSQRSTNNRLKPHSSQSSPSKIPRSRSQPPSTRISPNVSNVASRVNSRNPSRNVSRNPSRETSPTKLASSKANYRNVKAKVNSYHVKPKVPPKPQVPKQTNEQSQRSRSGASKTKINKNDNNNINSNKNVNNINNKSSNKDDRRVSDNNNKNNSNDENIERISVLSEEEQIIKNDSKSKTTKDEDSGKNQTKTEKVEGSVTAPTLAELLQPSTTAVVSSTTTTVTQPLKIEAKFDADSRRDTDKSDIVYLPDARALSATSVSTAMNRMNDTVLDSRTLMKETNLSSKLPPAASTIINMANNENQQRREDAVVDMRNIPSSLPPVETVKNSISNSSNDSDNTTFSSPRLNSNSNIINVQSANSNNNNKLMSANTNSSESNGKSTPISPDHGMVGLVDALPKSANERLKEARTMMATDVQPIKIMVKEKPMDTEVQSGNVRLPVSATNGINERPGLPPSQQQHNEPLESSEPPKGAFGRFLARFKKKPKTDGATNNEDSSTNKEKGKKVNLMCCARNKREAMKDRVDSDTSLIEEETNEKLKWWQKIKCCKRNKVADSTTSCFPKKRRRGSWAAKKEMFDTTNPPMKRSPKDACKNFFRWLFCINWCSSRKRRKEEEEAVKRRASMMSKKKSLTPQAPPEEPKSKLDAGLVEHTSLMKGAIPVLPVPLAWLCLILNVFLPGTGTIFSGFFCMCMGKPRFSTKDGAKQRLGACIIDFFIGCGQLFTVIFCLVGWGWSIWWGVIMLKIAKKYRKIRRAEKAMEEDLTAAAAANEANHLTQDVERGGS